MKNDEGRRVAENENNFYAFKIRRFPGSQRDITTSMFIAALFTIAKRWKKCKCPSADEWIKKMWHIDYPSK